MRMIISVAAAIALLTVVSAVSAPLADEPAPEKKAPDLGTLIGDLKGADPAARIRAKAVLAKMGEQAGPALLQALASSPAGEKENVIEILAVIRYRPAAPEIEKIWQETAAPGLKLRAAQALCRFDYNYSRYQSYILSQTGTGDADHRLLAMQMLGYIEDRRVVEPLLKIFNDPDQPDQMRQAAIWDLAHTPVEESAAALVNLVNSSEVDWFYKAIIISALRQLAARKEMAPVVSELLEKSQRLPLPSGGRPAK
ncbi:MAG: HEAT repeat domain-containing protein [PVC group bacterium]